MHMRTQEPVPRFFWAIDADTLVALLWLASGRGLSRSAYMAEANTRLLAQGRLGVDTTDAGHFLAGLAAQGILWVTDD